MSRHLLRLSISVGDILKYDETLQESTVDLKQTIADVIVLMALFQNQRARVVEVILKFTIKPTLTCNKSEVRTSFIELWNLFGNKSIRHNYQVVVRTV
jgi:hypothetical protein